MQALALIQRHLIVAVVVVVVVRVVELSGSDVRWYASPTSIALVCGLCPKACVITVSPVESKTVVAEVWWRTQRRASQGRCGAGKVPTPVLCPPREGLVLFRELQTQVD